MDPRIRLLPSAPILVPRGGLDGLWRANCLPYCPALLHTDAVGSLTAAAPGEVGMTLVLTATGILLIVITVFDIFRTLFDPEAQGPISNAVCWSVWKTLKAAPGPLIRYAGPVAYLSVLVVWTVSLLTAWALLFMAHLPESFAYAGAIETDQQSRFITAFYISLTTLGTLGYGDVTPTSSWLRVIGPAESLLGFLLLSAAITWILAIYQDLETRRSLAHETTLLTDALDAEGLQLSDLNPDATERIVSEVTHRIIRVTGSLAQFPITYFFRVSDERQSLAVMSLFLLELCEDLHREQLPREVRVRAQMLEQALNHLAEVLNGRFVEVGPHASARDVFQAYARDHQHTITSPGENLEEQPSTASSLSE